MVSSDLKKIALAKLEGQTLDWLADYGDLFHELRDLCFTISEQIDIERDKNNGF